MVCETQPTEWPFRNGGCVPVTITVTFETEDGSFSTSCATELYGERTAGCSVDVPFSSTVIATADPSGFPEGYALTSETSQWFEIPDGPPDGVFGGPVFIALPVAGDEPRAEEEPDSEDPVTEAPISEDPTGDESQSVTTLPVTGTGSTTPDTPWFLPPAFSVLMLLGLGAGLRLTVRSTPSGQNR